VATAEGWRSTGRVSRIHKTTHLGLRSLVVAWPWLSLSHGGRPWLKRPCSHSRARGEMSEGEKGGVRTVWDWLGLSIARGDSRSVRRMVRTRALHGGHAQDTRRPFRHKHEQVAGIEVSMVGRRFGPLLGRFRSWAKNEVYFPRAVLHFSFNGDGH